MCKTVKIKQLGPTLFSKILARLEKTQRTSFIKGGLNIEYIHRVQTNGDMHKIKSYAQNEAK